jgi:hypothetical protein
MVINLLSSPRNISTALMYSFAQRADTTVIDEPYYGYYLSKSDADHPGKDEIIASMPNSAAGCLEVIKRASEKAENVFVKNMAHHLIGMDVGFLKDFKNVFLIRDPKQLIASFAEVIPNPAMSDIGLLRQIELFEYLKEEGSTPPIVIDSNDILENPKSVLSKTCAALGIPFSQSMLSWPAGEIHDEVPWITFWYDNVLKSTGFGKQKTSERPLPENCRPLYLESIPLYQKLSEYAIKP